MPFKLSGLQLNRVDLCPAGANQGAEIVLFKSKGAKMAARKAAAKKAPAKKAAKADTRKKQKQRGDEEEEEEEEDDAVVKGRRGKAAKSEDDDEIDENDDVEEEEEEDDIEKSDDDDEDDLDGDVADDDEEDDEDDDERPAKKSKKTTPKTSAKKTKKTKKVAKVEDDEDDDDGLGDDEDDEIEELDEEVMKALPAHVRRRVEKTQRLAKEAMDIAKTERDKRITGEYIEKAKKDIPNLTGTAEEKGSMLKALFSGEPLSKAIARQVVKLLKTGDTAIRSLMMESGVRKDRSLTDDDSAYAQLEEKRDEILKANKGKLTKEQAMAKAVEDNPKLYRAYRLEKSRGHRTVDLEND